MRYEILLHTDPDVHHDLLTMAAAEKEYIDNWLNAAVVPTKPLLPSRLAAWLRRYARLLQIADMPTYHVPAGCWTYKHGVLTVTVTNHESTLRVKRTRRVSLEVLDVWRCDANKSLCLYFHNGNWVAGCEYFSCYG